MSSARPEPALPAGSGWRGHHPGRLSLAEPRPASSARHRGRRQGRGRAARARLLGRRMLSLGQALAAGLRTGLLASDVPVWLDTPMTGLEVTGRPGDRGPRDPRRRTGADRGRRGVLIATGGFERNEEMRRRYQRAPVGTEWTTGAAGNTGDGILAGQELGAATGLMDDAWWGPSIPLPGGPYFCLAERSLPGCLLVNGAGQRFVNESAPYVDAVHAMYDGEHGGEPAHPRLADLRPALPRPVRIRRPAAAQAAPPPLVRRRDGGPRGRPGRPRTRGRRRRRGPGQDRDQVRRIRRGGQATRISVAATRRTTATTATRAAGPTPTWPRWTGRRSTPSRSSLVTWAPRAACAPTSGPACSAGTEP